MLKLFIIFCLANVRFAQGSVSELNSDLNNALLQGNIENAQNSAWSPVSLLYGMGMLFEGMSDKSRAEVALDLGLGQSHDEFLTDLRKEVATKSDSKVQDNFIVIDEALGALYSYGESLNATLQTGAYRGNLSTEPEKSLSFINRRVNKKTFGKISKFLPPGSIRQDTTVVLVNVLYFNATWKKEFERKLQPGSFFLQNKKDKKVDADFMFGDVAAGYLKTEDGTEVIGLPFEGEVFEMVIIVPEKDLTEFVEKDLKSTQIFSKITEPETLERKLVSLRLPAFKIKTDSGLKSLLQTNEKFGSFFSKDTEYSRIAKNRVKVDEIHQSVVVDVNPSGVEAAAATGITISLYSAFIPDHEIFVNRPFLFFIVEKPTKMILFGGIVHDPTDPAS